MSPRTLTTPAIRPVSGHSVLILNASLALLLTCTAGAFLTDQPLMHRLLIVLTAVIALLVWLQTGRFRQIQKLDVWLQRLSGSDILSDDLLPRFPGNTPTESGWNRLVESISVQQLINEVAIDIREVTDGASGGIAASALNALPDGVAVTDRSGVRLYQNPAFASLLDCEVESGELAAALRFHELFRGFLNFSDHLNTLTNHGVSLAPRCFELHRGDSMDLGVLRVTRHCLGDDHETFLWTIRDTSQQKLAVESRDSFVSAATHELRTPLANIQAYAETLISGHGIEPDEQKQFLNVITSEARRLNRIIDDLLNVSRMQAGGLTMERHETQVERLLREVLDTIQPLFAKHQQEFESVIPPRIPELTVDKDKLAAALVNLLGNASKYTPDGGRISLQAEFDSTEVRFHIEDTGIGISDDEQAHIFERFFRSADQRVSEIRGTGLGLAFAQDVARLHGGRIEVHSELNKGSRFSLILPASLAKQPAAGSAS
ncbi:MAG: hypothetical protein KDA85_03070 [Planctomycetaceae bacterium]|nr:hypothetical protein [Planctomycetaceae bacterium]